MDPVRRPRVRAAGASAPFAGPIVVLALGLTVVLVAGAGAFDTHPPAGAPDVSAAPQASAVPQVATAVPTVDPIGTYDPNYTGPIAYQPSPIPGITPSPEPDPGHLVIPSVTLPTQSSAQVKEVQLGKELLPGFTQVSFHLVLTLGSDFATRLDRSIRVYGLDNVRYLADEPAVEPSLLNEGGYQLDGWVTFVLPSAMSGPTSIHITIDPGALTEIVIPVVIGDGVAQPVGVFTPTSLLLAEPTLPVPSASLAK